MRGVFYETKKKQQGKKNKKYIQYFGNGIRFNHIHHRILEIKPPLNKFERSFSLFNILNYSI